MFLMTWQTDWPSSMRPTSAIDARRGDDAQSPWENPRLAFPHFETDPHPALRRSVKLSLSTREIDCFEYATSDKPPVLHRKESFLTADHPLYSKFTRLSEQEQRHRLLDDPAAIGTREGWLAGLSAAGFALRGHRLVRRPANNRAAGVARSLP
jgi:hypothetical protein